MFSLQRILPRASRSPVCASCLRQLSTSRLLLKHSLQIPRLSSQRPNLFRSSPPGGNKFQYRNYVSKTAADELIENIQEQYATARDEFEIATEETEKKTLYAEGDREAARMELDALKDMYEEALEGEDGEEIKNRIGQRIRELDHAVQALEKSALED